MTDQYEAPNDVAEAEAATGEMAAQAVPVRPPGTDDARVDAALAELATTTGRPAAEHVEVFEDVHRRLQDSLASLDGEI